MVKKSIRLLSVTFFAPNWDQWGILYHCKGNFNLYNDTKYSL